MGDGDQRHSRRGVRYDSRELAKLSKQRAPTEADWDAQVAGQNPSEPSEPSERDAATLARTSTVDDPLTTSLLAEVSRRSETVRMSPEQIAQAMKAEAAAAGRAGDVDRPGAAPPEPPERPSADRPGDPPDDPA